MGYILISTQLKDLMKKHGYTRKWVADYCGISQSHFNHLIHGNRRASLSVLKLLEGLFKTKIVENSRETIHREEEE